ADTPSRPSWSPAHRAGPRTVPTRGAPPLQENCKPMVFLFLDVREGLGHLPPEDLANVIRAGVDWILSQRADIP
ncbi:MAG TPA: hypothetical protein VF115_06555, partial [Acidimicrobiia bacterium]